MQTIEKNSQPAGGHTLNHGSGRPIGRNRGVRLFWSLTAGQIYSLRGCDTVITFEPFPMIGTFVA